MVLGRVGWVQSPASSVEHSGITTGCPEKKDTHHFVSFFKARASIFSKLAIIVD